MANEIVQAPKQLAMTMADQDLFARSTADSDIIPAAYRGKPSNIIIAVGLGTSMGLSPAESLYRIDVIQGTPTASAELVAAQVRKAGHKLRIAKNEEAQSVTCTIVRCDDPDYPISVTRDRAWAQSMGLLNKENYKKQPMTMLTWRAITACAREACSEALFGVAYTPDEMTDFARQPDPVPVQAQVQPEPQGGVFERLNAKRQAAADQQQPEQQAPKATPKMNQQQAGDLTKLCSDAATACGMPMDEMKRRIWGACRWDGSEPWGSYMARAREVAAQVCEAALSMGGPEYEEAPVYEC